jgi:hypothetical protein
MNAIGFCARFSPQGDRALAYALKLARARELQLNIFHWLASPMRLRRDMVYADDAHAHVEPVTEELKVRKERELREYYDPKLGDYVEVGFRLCEGRETVELSRCLHRGEFDLLVVGYEEVGATFGDQTIEDFARGFRTPVVLVGPDAPDRYHLNGPAELILAELEIPGDRWSRLPAG